MFNLPYCETASNAGKKPDAGQRRIAPVSQLVISASVWGKIYPTTELGGNILRSVFREPILKNHIWCRVGSEISSENYFCSNYNIASTNKGKHCNDCRLQCKMYLVHFMEADTSAY